MFGQGLGDWNEMFGFEGTVEGPSVRVLAQSGPILSRIIGSGVLVSTETEGRVETWIRFVFPNDFIGLAISAAMMMPMPDEPAIDGENPEHTETAQELMNLFCGSATRVLEEHHTRMRVSQSVEHLRVEVTPDSSAELPEGAHMVCVKVGITSGEVTGTAWCVFPPAVAASLQ